MTNKRGKRERKVEAASSETGGPSFLRVNKQRPYESQTGWRLAGEIREEEHFGVEEGEADEEAEGGLILTVASIELRGKFG